MTKEELTNRAREFVCQLGSGTPQEMEYFANILVEFANETTKELGKENTDLHIDKPVYAIHLSDVTEE